MDGFFLIDKPAGWTSFDVCAKIRKIMRIKKVGHTGTLDPFATGLLIVAVGKCTKLIPFFEKDFKTYEVEILLGQTTETLDPEGERIDITDEYMEARGLSPLFSQQKPTQTDIAKILKDQFTGHIKQIPPKFSALKINGKRAYALAREGKPVEIKPRMTTIHDIEILSYTYPTLTLRLTAAAGFYVRSLARDLGEKLVGGGMCTSLKRTHIGDLSWEDAEPLEMITEPIDPKYLLKNLDFREIPSGRIQDFMAGRAFPFPGIDGEKTLVLCGSKSVGVGEFVHGKLQPRIVL